MLKLRRKVNYMKIKNYIYSEAMVRNKVEKVIIFNEYLEICCKNNDKMNIKFKEKKET